jgi:phosphate transport system substrate-binding protein
MKASVILPLLIVLVSGCTNEPGSTRLTEGKLLVECDESVFPVFDSMAAEFHDQYPDAKLTIRAVEARAAIADFFNDSVHVIISARAFNPEERTMLKKANIDFQEYHVAQSAVAVITNGELPFKQMRLTEVDSIFTGKQTRWRTGGRSRPIEVVAGDINSSTNEAFRVTVLGGAGFTLATTPMKSSGELISYIAKTRNTIGIIGIAWLKGFDRRVNVVELGGPQFRSDTTRPAGQYYSPAQAYVFQGYYPVTTPVYIYSRGAGRDLGLGFISYATSAAGQKVVTREGLVPVTMPVRLVQLTSDQVK